VAREGAVAALAGDHGGHAALLEPAEQAAQLGAQDRRVGERREQRLDRVDDHALGVDRVDRRAEPHEQPVEVPVAGLLDLGTVHLDVVDHEFAVGLELPEIEAQRRDVGGQILRRLLERGEHPRLVEHRRPADEELHPQQRLAATRRPADERRAATRQTAAGEVVETADPGRRLRQLSQ